MGNGVPVLSLVIHYVDVIQVGISPIHQLLDDIQCHSCGLFNPVVHQPRPVGAVHVAALDLGSIPVISEEHHSAESENDGRSSSMLSFASSYFAFMYKHLRKHLMKYFGMFNSTEVRHGPPTVTVYTG